MGISFKKFISVYVLRQAFRVNPSLGLIANRKYAAELVAIAKAILDDGELVRDLVLDGAHEYPRYFDASKEFELGEAKIAIPAGSWKRIADIVSYASFVWCEDGEIEYRKLIREIIAGVCAIDGGFVYRNDGFYGILDSIVEHVLPAYILDQKVGGLI